jgi:lysophospholipase L1-like esterase
MHLFARTSALLCAGAMAVAVSPAQALDPQDWAGLQRYAAENQSLGRLPARAQRVVFLGDSITDGWTHGPADVFAVAGRINRGISGQTTAQMLLRMRQDVIDLQPHTLVLLAGTNDIAGNTGPVTLAQIEANLASIIDLARVHGIQVVLCALLPADRYPWAPEIRPAQPIRELNRWIEAQARARGLRFVDFHSALTDPQGGLPTRYSEDGVHPNEAAYAVMRRLVESALAAPDRRP